MENQKSQGDNKELLLIIFVMVFFIMLAYLYEYFQVEIHSIILNITKFELLAFVFLDEPKEIIAYLKVTPTELLSQKQVMILFDVAGEYLSFLAIPIMIFMLFRGSFNNVIDKFRFRISANKLIEMNAEFIPALRPLRGLNILKESIDSGAWASARQAIQWAVENQVLLLPNNIPVDSAESIKLYGKLVINDDGLANEKSPCLQSNKSKKFNLTLDKDRAKLLFDEQIGHRVEEISAHEKAIATAFMAFGFGHKDKALELFDHMSTTYNNKTNELDFGKSEELWNEYIEKEKIKSIITQHGTYTRCFLSALLEFAREKGVISCSQFIWLRPYDRVLWYTLNQVGRKAPWIESAGV